MNKRQQSEFVYWRAPQMARSGHFHDWREIEAQLKFEGVTEAHHQLRRDTTRALLNALCAEARGHRFTKRKLTPEELTETHKRVAAEARATFPTAQVTVHVNDETDEGGETVKTHVFIEVTQSLTQPDSSHVSGVKHGPL